MDEEVVDWVIGEMDYKGMRELSRGVTDGTCMTEDMSNH